MVKPGEEIHPILPACLPLTGDMGSQSQLETPEAPERLKSPQTQLWTAETSVTVGRFQARSLKSPSFGAGESPTWKDS